MIILMNPPYEMRNRRGPKPYAVELQQRLSAVSGGELWSLPEWSPITSQERAPYLGDYRNDSLLYAPRLDLAVGPFATEDSLAAEFDRMLTRHQELIERLLRAHRSNMEVFPDNYLAPDLDSLLVANPNPRCFMAIEIERGNRDMKYLLGSAFQAAAWGKLGLVICWNGLRRRNLMGVREMLSLLSAYGKNTLHTGNLLILDKDQMDRVFSPA